MAFLSSLCGSVKKFLSGQKGRSPRSSSNAIAGEICTSGPCLATRSLLGSVLGRCLGAALTDLCLCSQLWKQSRSHDQQATTGREIGSASAPIPTPARCPKGTTACPGSLHHSRTGKPVASCTRFCNFWLTACVCGDPISRWRLQITEDLCQHGHYDNKKKTP